MLRPLLSLTTLAATLTGQVLPPIEHGRVAWARDFAAAQARAKAQGLPLLTLFQEVPG
jgi:hypothetical protein